MNPYEILAVHSDATPHDIVQAAALALRTRKYSATEIAEARMQLMNPEKRIILDFIYHVDISPLLHPGKGTDTSEPTLSVTEATERLEYLSVFES